jgi:hypothetical protein
VSGQGHDAEGGDVLRIGLNFRSGLDQGDDL